MDKLNENKPIIWMYWQNKKGSTVPDCITLCWKTIIANNKNDFQIKILNEQNVNDYLPNLNKNYLRYKEIAHKADYIRFCLLYEYGGIWLDSDTIIFRSLKEIMEKVDEYGFVCTGYKKDATKKEYFTIINFLASKPKNTICLMIKEHIENFINEQLVNGIEQEWDFVGYYLSSIINSNNHKYFLYPISYFYPLYTYNADNVVFERIINMPNNIIKDILNYSFGQSLANSVRSSEFKSLKEEELLNSEHAYSKLFKFGLNKTEIKNNEDIDYIIYSYLKEIQLQINMQESRIKKLENQFNNLINTITWFIPVRKWRDNFRNKFFDKFIGGVNISFNFIYLLNFRNYKL